MSIVKTPDNRPMSLKLSMDNNGNKILKVAFIGQKMGFSVQTNQNLPITHRMTKDWFDGKAAASELRLHIIRFGTLRQRDVTGYSLGAS